jgi:site-specific recombinase XerD
VARRSSLTHQIQNVLKEVNGIGTSKKESRENSGIKAANGHPISPKFHSYKSLTNARRDFHNLGRFAKEIGIRNLSEINIEVVEQWIRSKDIVYHTASNYISEILKIQQHLDVTQAEIQELRKELKIDMPRKGEIAQSTRSYKHLEHITLPERSQVAFELQRDYGLRAKEATHIHLERQLHGNTLKYTSKGGKLMKKEITPTLASKIREMAKNGKYEVSRDIYRADLKKEIIKTKQKFNGTHGIRHTYAQRRIAEGATLKEVSLEMGHVRESITLTYLR